MEPGSVTLWGQFGNIGARNEGSDYFIIDGKNSEFFHSEEGKWPMTRLFSSSSADSDSMATSQKSNRSLSATLDRHTADPNSRQWQTVLLSKDLRLLETGKGCGNLTEEIRSGNFPDFLDKTERSRFREIVSRTKPGEVFSNYFLLANGRTMEILLIDRNEIYELHCCFPEQGIHPLKHMSLLYRNFLTSSEAVVFTDPAGTIVDVNQTFLDLYGYRRDEVVGQNPRILKSGRQPPAFYKQLWKNLTDKNIGTWSGEVTNHKKNGEEVIVSLTINSIRDESGTVIGYIGHTLDVTERKRMEEALARAKEEWERTFDAVPDLISILDKKHRIVRVNKAMADKLKAKPEDMIGITCYSCVHGGDGPLPSCPHSCLLADGKEHIVEVYEERLGGYFLVSTSPLYDAEGNLTGSVHVARDITERKRAEDELRKKDRELEAKNRELQRLNTLKSDLMAITSHDLKSPLSAMIGYANLLKERQEELPAEKTIRYLDRITESGERLMRFISELLDLEKIDSGTFRLDLQPIRLDELLKSCVMTNAITARTKQISISFCREGALQLVLADAVRMEQVFNNILSNAVKFSPENSKIEVTYTDEDSETVRITICDQGPGIPEEDLETIFDRYYQVLKKGSAHQRAFGSGLGLNIVKNLVNLHGGTVKAQNRLTGGCCFTLTIPRRSTGKRDE